MKPAICYPRGSGSFLVEDSAAVGKLLDLDVAVITKLPMAVGVPTGDTLKYMEFHSVGPQWLCTFG